MYSLSADLSSHILLSISTRKPTILDTITSMPGSTIPHIPSTWVDFQADFRSGANFSPYCPSRRLTVSSTSCRATIHASVSNSFLFAEWDRILLCVMHSKRNQQWKPNTSSWESCLVKQGDICLFLNTVCQ